MKNKKNCLVILVLVLVFTMTACASLDTQNITLDQAIRSTAQTIEARIPQGEKVAVLVFDSPSQALSDYIIDELAETLANGNRVQIIERRFIDAIRRELNIQMSGDVHDDEMRRIGNQLGAQFIVTGTLSQMPDFYRLRVVAIDVETAVRAGNASVDIDKNDPQVVFFLNENGEAGNTEQTPQQVVAPPTEPSPFEIAEQNFNLAYSVFIERVGQMNASLLPQGHFYWANSTETLTYRSRVVNFSGTYWGVTYDPISFYKEFVIRFQGRNIVNAQWRYVYTSATSWFGVGNPSPQSPIMSNWFTTAVPDNNVGGSGVDGVINTLIHFVGLRVNGTYTFRRGNGSEAYLTVESLEPLRIQMQQRIRL